MRPLPRIRPLRRPATFWALAGVSQLVAHDAVFLVQVGPGEPLARALRSGGHAYWETASVLLLGLGAIAAAAIAVRLAGLARVARRVGRPTSAVPMSRASTAFHLWLRLFAVLVVGFTIQENVEHVAGHAHAIGLAALHGPEYPLALPVLALVSLVAAVIGAMVLGVERRLVAALATLVARIGRAPRRAIRPPRACVPTQPSPLASRGAGRAPPLAAVIG